MRVIRWLGRHCVGSSACFRPFSRHGAVADHQKNQDEKKYPDRAGEVSLIEVSHLRPYPKLHPIRKGVRCRIEQI